MFNIVRRPDSSSVWIEILDTTLHDRETAHDLYNQIEQLLVREYLEKHREEILSAVSVEKVAEQLPLAICTALLAALKKEPRDEQ